MYLKKNFEIIKEDTHLTAYSLKICITNFFCYRERCKGDYKQVQSHFPNTPMHKNKKSITNHFNFILRHLFLSTFQSVFNNITINAW